jgi:hypothetical protein
VSVEHPLRVLHKFPLDPSGRSAIHAYDNALYVFDFPGFNGNSFTFWLESFSPLVPLAAFEVVLGFPFETPAEVCGLAAIDSTF